MERQIAVLVTALDAGAHFLIADVAYLLYSSQRRVTSA